MMKDLVGAFRLDMEPAAKPFHYKMSGLNNVWLINGFHEEQTAYGRGIRVENADGLHRLLAHVIVSDKAAMCGAELRFVRKLMGLSQNGLSRSPIWMRRFTEAVSLSGTTKSGGGRLRPQAGIIVAVAP